MDIPILGIMARTMVNDTIGQPYCFPNQCQNFKRRFTVGRGTALFSMAGASSLSITSVAE